MNAKVIPLIILSLFFGTIVTAQVKVDVEKKVTNEANQRANTKTDQAIDKTFDKLEEGIGSLFGKKKKKKNESQETENDDSEIQQEHNSSASDDSDSNNINSDKTEVSPQINVQWSKFDFVPGDEVIFEDGPSASEENGEFPSRWDLYEGGAEILKVDGEMAITFITASGNMYRKGIVPYLKNSKSDYLPDVFTIEFDAYYMPNEYNQSYFITLWDRKNQKNNANCCPQLQTGVNEMEMGTSQAVLAGSKRSNIDEVGGWRHISVAYTKGKFKAYLNDQRLINIPHLEGNPSGITISGTDEKNYIKNIRIAKGGVKYYDRVISDGKIVCNGIKFDVNKATLKPESMGPINEIFGLMQNQPDLKFSVEGHTDSDGDDAFNQALSEQRAKTVMDKLIEMGISADRLTSKGFGESKPVSDNSTAEGKANNRRVEFVKF